jgi:hypothetical protein
MMHKSGLQFYWREFVQHGTMHQIHTIRTDWIDIVKFSLWVTEHELSVGELCHICILILQTQLNLEISFQLLFSCMLAFILGVFSSLLVSSSCSLLLRSLDKWFEISLNFFIRLFLNLYLGCLNHEYIESSQYSQRFANTDNIPPRKEEWSYAYSGKLSLIVDLSSIPLLRNRLKNPPAPAPCDLHMFSFMTTFVLCFMMGNGDEALPKMRGLDSATTSSLAPFLGTLPPCPGALPYTKSMYWTTSSLFQCLNDHHKSNSFMETDNADAAQTFELWQTIHQH